MPEETEKSPCEVYQNIGPALTLTPEDFGFISDPVTGQLFDLETCENEKDHKDDHGTV